MPSTASRTAVVRLAEVAGTAGLAEVAGTAGRAGRARWPRGDLPLLVAAAVFMVLHALLHAWDIVAGRLPVSHAFTDLPLILLPAALTVALAFWLKDD